MTCNLGNNSWIHVFYLSLMFSLHLYKNTEYSRVLTRSGNCYIRFLAPRLIPCPEPFDSPTLVGWDGSLQPESTVDDEPSPGDGPQRNSVPEQSFSQLMHEAASGLHTSEALTKAGKWETVFFLSILFLFFCFVLFFCSQLRPVAAHNIHKLCKKKIYLKKVDMV